jgi:hypothetical protein
MALMITSNIISISVIRIIVMFVVMFMMIIFIAALLSQWELWLSCFSNIQYCCSSSLCYPLC